MGASLQPWGKNVVNTPSWGRCKCQRGLSKPSSSQRPTEPAEGSEICYPKCAACCPGDVLSPTGEHGLCLAAHWGVLRKVLPLHHVHSPVAQEGIQSHTPCMDPPTPEAYRGEGEISELVVPWPGRTCGVYYWQEVQHTCQHHPYHTSLTFLKA